MNTNKLKEVRIERGMSISELARRAQLSRVTVTDIELDRTNPTIKTIVAICKAIDRNPSAIFFGNDVNHELQNSEKRRERNYD